MIGEKSKFVLWTVIFVFICFYHHGVSFATGDASTVSAVESVEDITKTEDISAPDTPETSAGVQEELVKDTTPDAGQSSVNNIKELFSADLRILAYGVAQQPSKSMLNPNNDLLEIPRYIANLEVRPDLSFQTSFLDCYVKPRAKLDFSVWQEGTREGDTAWSDDWYINEWLVRLKAWNRIFISYGRENLQWGPSFIYSPSNPFFGDNGRRNTFMEVRGMDFGRVIIVPHRLWSISFIVNTDDGRYPLINNESFDKIFAAKLDYTGRSGYASLIYSVKESSSSDTLGFFGGWTATDALLLYTEGSLREGSDAWYPVKDGSLLGASLQKIYSEDNEIKPVVLVGGSYTFENSGTLTLEYLYNGRGYDRDQADLYYATIQTAADMYYVFLNSVTTEAEKKETASLFRQFLSTQNIDTGLIFLRKNYAMLQYSQANIMDRLAVTFRWTQNIDDGSGQLFGLLSYALGDHWEIFASGMLNLGKKDTEFGSILDYQSMLGLKFAF
jgi:hypothetical protein